MTRTSVGWWTAAAAAGVVALLATSGRAEAPSSWRVTRSEVRVICPLTLGGAFEARTDALRGTLSLEAAHPVTFAGELLVDLRTLDTGIRLRNDHLRDVYLEVGRGDGFDKAVLSRIALVGIEAEMLHGRTGFSGTLFLHGVGYAVSGQAQIDREPGSVRVEASFPVTLADYGIRKPQYLGVGVKEQIQVRVLLWATSVDVPTEEGR